jgi:soluble lytic murein transglycosylase
MRAVSLPIFFSRAAARCLSGVLSVLMVALPVAAQSSDDSVRNSGHLSARSPKSKSTKKKPAGKSHKPASRGVTASRAARAARTARLRQAFVASTELRPMAQQLATMRTPEAYAGVTAYARKHTGEAAAAAYLALGHAYLLDKRYAESETSLRQARQAG